MSTPKAFVYALHYLHGTAGRESPANELHLELARSRTLPDTVIALIETGSNQRYLFATNKLGHAVGASGLLKLATTLWVKEAVEAQTSAQILLATSGKAIVRCRGVDEAKELVWQVTSRALVDAPGMAIHGSVSDPFDWNTGQLEGALTQVHQRLAAARRKSEVNQLRFSRLPVMRDCDFSSYPAACVVYEGNSSVALSHPVLAKAKAKRAAYKQLPTGIHERMPEDLGELEKILEGKEKWIAVIHADGNGLGEIFTNFGQLMASALGTEPTDDQHVEALASLSKLLDDITASSFAAAAQTVWSDKNHLPILPLVIGGDDLSLVCSGNRAVQFAAEFAKEFVTQTLDKADDELCPNLTLRMLLSQSFALPTLGMSVGVAITKPHFPFSIAHGLAAELLKSAKQIKTELCDSDSRKVVPSASVDFHVVFDSSVMDLASIRERSNTGLLLHSGPFVVSDWPPESGAEPDWLKAHKLSDLWESIDLLCGTSEDGKRTLPASQTHALRDALHRSTADADKRLAAITNRYPAADLAGSPLAQVKVPNTEFTRWIDAMTLADLTIAGEAK